MILRRSTDVADLNYILNDPSIYPWVSDVLDGPLDATTAWEAYKTLLYITPDKEGAFWCVQYEDPAEYEVHTQFTKACRYSAIDLAPEVVASLFNEENCQRITTQVPESNTFGLRLIESLPFKYVKTEGMFVTPKGPSPLRYYRLDKD